MLCWSQQLHAMASIVEEQCLVTRHFFHSTLRRLNPKEKKKIMSFNTFKNSLEPGAVWNRLVTEVSDYRAVKHLPAFLWLRNLALAGEARVGTLWVTARTSPPSAQAATALPRGASCRAGTDWNTVRTLDKLRLVYPSVPAATARWQQLLPVPDGSNWDAVISDKYLVWRCQLKNKLIQPVSDQKN